MRSPFSQRRKLLLAAVPAVLLFGLFTAFFISYLFHGDLHTYKGNHPKTITIDHLANGTFAVERVALDWLPQGESDELRVCNSERRARRGDRN